MLERSVASFSSSRAIDLGEPLEATTPHAPAHPSFTSALLRRHGDAVREDGGSAAFEVFHMGTHTGTHVDALCHASLAGRLFGDVDASDSLSGGRFKHHGIDTLQPIFTRGVLLDLAALIEAPAVPAGRPITVDALEEACARQGVDVTEGDAVLFRMGRPTPQFVDIDRPEHLVAGVPGPDIGAARWLAERGVRIAGSDTIAFEWVPPGRGTANLPVHTLFLVQKGIPIMELLNLEELAATGVHEFLFVAVPLNIMGATGSPIRPLALLL